MDGEIITIREEDGIIYPNEIKGWFFPNWFEKEHFEIFMGKDLTDEEFEYIKGEIEEDLCDEVSEIVSNHLQKYGDEILEEMKNG